MKIKTNFTNLVIPDQYGCNVSKEQLTHGINQVSFPFAVTDIPQDAKYLSWSLIDYDTIPLIGFAWIHWLVGNCPVDQTNLIIDSNFSQSTTIPQGRTSLNSLVQTIRHPFWKRANFYSEITTHYAGPRPRNGSHNYRLTVYATDTALALENGFGQNDLLNCLDSNLIEQTSLNLSYERRN